RDQGRSHTASMLAGCVFAFSGFMATNEWPQMFNGALWMPLILLFVFRAWRGEQPLISGWLAGLFLGVAWLSGHHQIPTFITVALGFLWLYLIFRNRRLWLSFVLFLSATVLTSALQTLTAWEYGHRAVRWAGAPEPVGWNDLIPYTVHTQFSTPPTSLLAVALPGKSVHTEPFMGPIALVLAGLGMWAGFGSPTVRVLSALAVFGLLLAIGPATFMHGLLYSLVPLVEKARSPSMAVVIFNFSLAALTAWGTDHLHERRRTITGAALLVVAGIALMIAATPGDDRTFAVGLMSLLAAGALAAFRPLLAGPFAALAVLLQLSTVCGAYFPNRHDPNVAHNLIKVPQAADVVAFLHTRTLPLRVAVKDEDIPYNFGDMYGVEQSGGYLASLTSNFDGLELHTERSQQVFAVGYYVARKAERPNQIPLFRSRSGLQVFENPDTLPRARVVRRFRRVANRGAVGRFIADSANDLSTTAVMLTEPPQVESCGGPDSVHIIRYIPNEVRMRANLACRGLVVLADTNFPGWHATVDGRPAQIHEVYGAFRGVVVEGGRHIIEMIYRPWTALAGGVLTLAGLASGLLVWLIARR
ncbi:MAG TPA: hypothetical protein VFL57_01005, partial [Bryobacteraceae bacterium]|nr:hypothetical protein [Bryobacteraceae bacterium]